MNQLRIMQAPDLSMVNEMMRELYVNELVPTKAKGVPPRRY